jgi:hypothetical protein
MHHGVRHSPSVIANGVALSTIPGVDYRIGKRAKVRSLDKGVPRYRYSGIDTPACS